VRNGLALFLLAGRSIIAIPRFVRGEPSQQVGGSRDASQKLKPATGIPATAKIVIEPGRLWEGGGRPAALRVAGNRGIS